MFNYRSLLFIILLHRPANTIPIDNGVEGDPEIECGGTSITINFNTKNNFEGHVYVKGLYNSEGCRNDDNGRQVAGIILPFDTCSVARTRSLNPKGVFVSTTVVITFHPNFITKIDRAYRIQCFYMEADKTVSTDIEVSDMTTAFHSQVVPMPICHYEILSEGPEGQPVAFASIGDQVYHKWTCDTETVDTFCAVVHSCFVDDGNGDQVQIIDADGCALDRYILNNLEYPTDLMAGQEAHVYKYADRSQLFYQCQITITIKEPNVACPRPQCSEPEGRGAGTGVAPLPVVSGPAASIDGSVSVSPIRTRSTTTTTTNSITSTSVFGRRRRQRQRRSIATNAWNQRDNVGTMDVRTELNALDIMDHQNLPSVLNRQRYGTSSSSTDQLSSLMIDNDDGGICLSKTGITISLLLLIGAGSMSIIVIVRSLMMHNRSMLSTVGIDQNNCQKLF